MTWRDRIPSPGDIEFSDWPHETAMAQYETAATEVVELVHRVNGGASVYQLGGVRAPGISDLDFVIILNEVEPHNDLSNWTSLARSLTPETRYVVDNKPLIIDQRLWSMLPTLQPCPELRHLSGPVLATGEATGEAAAASHLLGSIELRLFVSNKELRSRLQWSVHVRRALKRLAKVRIQAEVLSESGIQNPGWWDFSRDVTELRTNWFSMTRSEQVRVLYELLVLLEEIEANMIMETSEALTRMHLVPSGPPQPRADVAGFLDYDDVFVEDYSPSLRLNYIARSFQAARIRISVWPANFMLPLSIYAQYSPALDRLMQDRLAILGRVPKTSMADLDPGVQERIRILEQYSRFRAEHHYRWALLLDMWEFPHTTIPSSQFWRTKASRIKHVDDVLPLVLGRKLEQSNPRLARLAGFEFLRFYLRMRQWLDWLAPRGSLRRRLLKAPLRAVAPILRRVLASS